MSYYDRQIHKYDVTHLGKYLQQYVRSSKVLAYDVMGHILNYYSYDSKYNYMKTNRVVGHD